MMKLVEKHVIKKSHPNFKELQHVCRLSKNLYNAANYEIRQEFTKKENSRYIHWIELSNKFAKEDQFDFRALPAKVSQQVLKKLHANWVSFFSLIKDPKNGAKIPKYLNKQGYFVVEYTKQAISKVQLTKGYLQLSGIKNFKLMLNKVNEHNLQSARIIPKGTHIVVEIIYSVNKIEHVESEKFASIDLGLNNLMTVVSTEFNPVIYSGRALKSINQFYNKELSRLKSESKNKTTNRILRLVDKRNNKVNDYLHKTSRHLINHLVSQNVSELVIGNNKNWKQEINIGRRNNQNFVQIPHSRLIEMIKYKAELVGIKVVVREESYTSKCSFLDREEIKKHETYLGKRIKRGLFKSSEGKIINADVNGAANILSKHLNVVGKINLIDSIEVCSAPIRNKNFL